MTQTATPTFTRADPGLRRVGRLMRTVGIVGVLAGIVAVALGLWLLRDLEVLLTRSLDLTAESLDTVDSSLDVATGTVEAVRTGLGDAEQTSEDLQTSFTEGATVLEEAARLTRSDVASSLEAVQATLPTIVQVGGTIDGTLRAIDQLGVGDEYSPQEPFDVTLQSLQDSLAGLPDDLRAQAESIDQAGDNLRTVGDRGVAVSESIGEARTSLEVAGQVLGEYQTTASQAAALLDATRDDLGRRVLALQAVVVVLGLVYCIGQLFPLYLGHRLAKAFAPPPDELGDE